MLQHQTPHLSNNHLQMGRTPSPEKQLSLLEVLERCCDVDVDDVSTDVVNSVPFTPHNRTFAFY